MLESGLPADPQETTLVVGASAGKDICTDTEQMPVLLYQFSTRPPKMCTPPGCKPRYMHFSQAFFIFPKTGSLFHYINISISRLRSPTRKGPRGKAQCTVRMFVMIKQHISVALRIFQSTVIFTVFLPVSFNPRKAEKGVIV